MARIKKLIDAKTPPEQAIEELYLAAFARLPNDSERGRRARHVARAKDSAARAWKTWRGCCSIAGNLCSIIGTWVRSIGRGPAGKGESAMIALSPELKRALDSAGESPIRIEDPQTTSLYVVIREEDYKRLREESQIVEIDPSLFEFEEIVVYKP